MSIPEFNLYLIGQSALGNFLILEREEKKHILYDDDILRLSELFDKIEKIEENVNKIKISLKDKTTMFLKEF